MISSNVRGDSYLARQLNGKRYGVVARVQPARDLAM
jgi:hypothetical protein